MCVNVWQQVRDLWCDESRRKWTEVSLALASSCCVHVVNWSQFLPDEGDLTMCTVAHAAGTRAFNMFGLTTFWDIVNVTPSIISLKSVASSGLPAAVDTGHLYDMVQGSTRSSSTRNTSCCPVQTHPRTLSLYMYYLFCQNLWSSNTHRPHKTFFAIID